MNEAKVTKGDVVALAQAMGEDVNDANRRIHALSVTLDCLITVLGKGEEVKAEIQRRIEAAKAKPECGGEKCRPGNCVCPGKLPEQTPLISVP
jgi:hypothetical protein